MATTDEMEVEQSDQPQDDAHVKKEVADVCRQVDGKAPPASPPQDQSQTASDSNTSAMEEYQPSDLDAAPAELRASSENQDPLTENHEPEQDTSSTAVGHGEAVQQWPEVLPSVDGTAPVRPDQTAAAVGADRAPAVVPDSAGAAPPVAVLTLDRPKMLNMVLAGCKPVSAISHLPTRLQLPLPREGFMCDQCGDRFVLPSSLALHQSRRTMEIAFKCSKCKKTCLFDNKCKLLEHLDGHRMDPQSLDPESVEISSLTAADLSSPTRVIPVIGSRALTGPPKLARMGHVEKVDRPVGVSCPMCNTLCTTSSLASHMCPVSGSDALDTVPPRCPECAQPCPSECALLAHHGLHKPDLWPYPYVCPECSVKVLGSHEEYRRHVVAACLHLTRDLKTCCSICLIEVGDVKSHMLQTHVQKLYKCRKCPLAFESINGFNSHVKGKHSGEPMLGDLPYMPILKCPFCAATFNHPKTLREHLGSKKHGDRTLEQVRFVFRCPECEVDYGRKELLSDHLAQKHPDFQIAAMDVPTPQPEPEPAPPLPLPLSAPAPAAVAAPLAPTRAAAAAAPRPPGRPAKQATPAGAAAAGGRRGSPAPPTKLEPGRKPAVHACIVCAAEYRRKSAYLEHVRVHLNEGVPLCLLCNTQLKSTEVLKNHIAEHASEIGRDRCGLCYAKLGSRDALQEHLETDHNLRNFTCQHCGHRFGRLNDLHRHNFAKHRGAKSRPARPLPAARDGAVAGAAPPAAGQPADEDDEDELDNLPLSVLGARKGRRGGTLPGVTSLYELDSEASSVVSDGDEPGGRRRRRGGVKRPRADDEPPRLSRVSKRSQSPDEAAFVERPAPALPASGYRCVCCGLQTDVRADFVAHVQLHRQGSQHQCPECGQCYSTKPSLLKHLLLVHRLRKPPPELADAERQRELLKWEELMRGFEPDQCHVCRVRCGDEERLQQHLRSHGRAALRVHQRELARRQRRLRQAEQQSRPETLEDIASFVAGGRGADAEDDGDEDEVIELEMKEGEITQKQLRKRVPLVRDESSDEDAEEAAGAVHGNGDDAGMAAAAVTVSANGHEGAAAEGAGQPPAAVASG